MQLKNKNSLFALAFITATNISLAQSYTIIPGEERVYDKKEGVIFKGYLEFDGKTLYENRAISEIAGESEMINRLDINKLSGPAKIANFKLDIAKRDILTEVELQRAIVNDKACVITSAFNMDEAKKIIYVRKTDFNKLSDTNDKSVLMSLDCNKKDVYANNFNVFFSPDKSKLLVLHSRYTDANGISQTAYVFDVNSFNKISEMPLKHTLKGEALRFGNFMICNNGDIVCTPAEVSIVYSSLGAPNVKYYNLSPVLFRFKLKESVPQIIDFPKECSENSLFNIQAEGESIFVYGACAGPRKKRDEVFYAKFDLGSNTFTDFKIISSTPISKKLEETKGNYILASKLLVTPENIFVLCHNSYNMQMTSQNGSFSSTYTVHYDKELVVARFSNSSNDNKKLSLIPKFCNNKLADYHTYVKNGSLYVIYAEHPKNLEEYTLKDYDAAKYRIVGTYNGSITVCTRLDADGSMKRETLFENKGWCFKPENLDVVLEKENALILHMIKGKKERFDKLIIK